MRDAPAPGRASRGSRSAPPARARSLAKLTRPRLHAAYPRERLFRLLDDARTFPVVWIAGPPGAGKTTVAATWLEARALPGIWYQLDSGDADPATFFYYLRQAAEAACVESPRLPLLTTEYQHDIPAFARRWFRELFMQLPEGAVLALDNYQEISADSPLHRALAAACDELSRGDQLIVVSRAEPPPEFSRAVASERLRYVPGDALRLTLDEAEGIVAGKDALTAAQIQELRAACGGWAAGFTLLRERTRRTGLVNQVDERATMQEVFDYFMAQVFRDLPVDSRDALVQLSVLPHFTDAMAAELTGNDAARDLLDSLYRRHLFVERRYGAEITYELHVLFRAFLLDRARRTHSPSMWTELAARAASLLERSGAREDALQLRIDSGDSTGAAIVLEGLAPGLIATGRGAAYREWLAKLPGSERDARPSLSYWLGSSLMGVHSLGARDAYERAHAAFLRDGDRTGQAMALVGLLDTFLHNRDDDASRVQRWLAALEPLLASDQAFPSRALAAHAYGTLVTTMYWIAPAHPLFPLCIRRLEALLAGPLEDGVRVVTAGQLAEYYAAAGFVRDAERLVAATEGLARDPSLPPMARTYWRLRTCSCDWAKGEFAKVGATLDEALSIAAEQGRGPGGYIAGVLLATLALDVGNPDAVPSLLEQAPALIPTYVSRSLSRNQGAAVLHSVKGRYAAVRGDLDEAERELDQACRAISDEFVTFQFNYRTALASVLIERGDLDRARTVIEAMRWSYPRDRFPVPAFRCDALEAVVAAASGASPRLDALATSLRELHALGVEVPVTSQPIAARQIAELLVRNDIELPYVHAWIRRAHLRPRSPAASPSWPWPVRIRTLGEFHIEVDGAPLRFRGKVPRKPLELLKAIAAFGGNEICSETLCNALWPDSDGDTADAALRMTLSRLRKLLKRDAIVQHQGRISLDAGLCWLDVWSLRAACQDVQAGRGNGVAPVLDLYRGAFLHEEREEPWMRPARNELRRLFSATVARMAGTLERDGRAEEAAALRREASRRDAPKDQ